MSLLSKLFGKSSAPAEPAGIDYQGFTITPRPMPADGQWRLSAVIEKDGKTHHLIRADTLRSSQEADKAAIEKAKQVIDRQGDRLF